VRKNPALVVLAGVFREPTHTLPSGRGHDGPVPQVTSGSHFSTIDVATGFRHAVGSPFPHEPNQPTLHPPTPPAPSTSSASSRYEKTHACTYCGTAYDRSTRARDCRNMDLGMTPHRCLGRCGKPGW
jgi:hypothetical protein